MAQLLIRDPERRLGSIAGAEDIKAHPFFKGINWALIRNSTPPFVPRRSKVPAPSAQANAFNSF